MSVNDSVELSAGDKTSCDEDEVLLLDTGESGRFKQQSSSLAEKLVAGTEVGERGVRCCYLILESQVDQQQSSSLAVKLVAGTEVGERGVMMPHCYG